MSRPDPALAPSPLDLLWREHRRFVAAVLIGHAPKQVDTEDLLQEVAVAFVRAFHTLKDPGLLKPWLRTIAINAARSAARRVKIQQRHLRPLPGDENEVVDPSQEKNHVRAERADQANFVRSLLDKLHPDYREPLVLRCVDGLSQKQIAQALCLPETTIETRLARGRRMLRGELSRSHDTRCTREGT